MLRVLIHLRSIRVQVPRKGNSGEFPYLMPLVRDAVHLLVQALNKSVSYLATNDTLPGICPGNGLHTQCGGSQLGCVLRTMLLQSDFEGESVRLENCHWECCARICMFVCMCECMHLFTGMCVCMFVCVMFAHSLIDLCTFPGYCSIWY